MSSHAKVLSGCVYLYRQACSAGLQGLHKMRHWIVMSCLLAKDAAGGCADANMQR